MADHRSLCLLRYQNPSAYWRKSRHLPAAEADSEGATLWRQRRGFRPTSLAADIRSYALSVDDAPESSEVVTTSGLDTIVNCIAPDLGQRTRGVANTVGGISIAEEPTQTKREASPFQSEKIFWCKALDSKPLQKPFRRVSLRRDCGRGRRSDGILCAKGPLLSYPV